ncbi:gamma-glutamylcyclotransferase family protein [Cohnella hongkongensis]|uniref:Gamma-glutamylcyclotransferase n=1 Tax=Cohnella hongkongensis TaxID=178337 RepID=A0ABV9FI54_9BACL
MKTVRVFVYGSLLPGQCHHDVVKPYLHSVAPGAVRGRLVDAGPYPALLPDGSDRIVRGAWLEISREGLTALDELEDFRGIEELNDYERVWLTDAHRPSLAGWGYIWPEARGFPFAEAEEWPDVLRRRKIE